MPKKKLIVIVGPTAIGKTALSIFIAQFLKSEIISADSRQFYRELKIGTATPSDEALNAVKHHFIGNLSITDYYSVSNFENEALAAISNIHKQNDYAVIVGGSGLYVNAVCDGIDDLPDPDEKTRNELNQLYEKEGLVAIQNKLKELDPEFYKKIDIANPKRIIRAIEVCITSGKTYTSLRTNPKRERDFEIIKIGLNRDREELFGIINNRVDAMIASGLVEEVEGLVDFKNYNALNTVGYKEIFDYLDNKMTLEKAIEKIKTNSRRYAKRQLTWFNKDKTIKWFHPEDRDRILEFIKM